MTEHLERPDGARIAYEVAGSGPVLLFVHGGTGIGAYDWEFQAGFFRERGWRTVVMDLRAHGRSTDPADLLSLEAIASDAEAVALKAGPVAAVIGFSVGGTALLKLFAEQPTRTFARALVLVGASIRGNPAAVAAITTGAWLPDLVALRHDASDDPNYWKGLRLRLARTWASDLDLSALELAQVSVPVLAIAGARDRVELPETARRIAASVPDAEHLIIEGAGHLAQRDRPDVFNAAVLEFLARRLGPG